MESYFLSTVLAKAKRGDGWHLFLPLQYTMIHVFIHSFFSCFHIKPFESPNSLVSCDAN